MTNGLKKVFLCSSVFKSKLTELDCFGHTNIVGGNASGKTTLLSLIPVFYGIEPNKMVTRTGEKTHFQGYYLPNKHSMIVFQYSKAGEDFCSVLYRNGDGIAYRFITGAASETIFEAETFKSLTPDISAKDWLRDVIQQKHETSLQLTTSVDYRAVIQNDKSRTRARRKQGHGLMLAANRYSLCDSSVEMKHIDALSAVLINKSKLLSSFKSMVVDSFLSDQIEIGESPFHRDDKEYVDSLQVLIKLQSHEKDFREAIESNEDLKSSWSIVLAAHSFLSDFREKISSQVKSDKERRTELAEQFKAFRARCDDDIGRARESLNDLTSKIKSQIRIVDTIHETREWWDDKENIASVIAEYECLEDFAEQAEKDAKHYEELLDIAKKEQYEHHAKVANAETQYHKEVATVNERITKVKSEIQSLRDTAQEAREQRAIEYHKDKDVFLAKRDELLQSLLDIKTERTTNKALASSHTAIETAQLAETDMHINELDEKISQLSKALEQAHSEEHAAQRQRDDSLKLRDSKSTELSSKRDEREDLLALISPQDRTLRAFLNTNVPEWNITLGKVLRPEVLSSKALSPELTDGGQTLMGVSLNLDNLDVPEYAQKNEVLEQRKTAVERDIANLESEIKNLDAKLKVENKALNYAGLMVLSSRKSVEATNTHKDQLKLRRSGFVVAFADAIKLRVKEAEAQLSDINEEIADFKRLTTAELVKMNARYRESELQIKSNCSSEEVVLAGKITTLSTRIVELKESLALRKSELNNAFKAMLQKKGVDPRKEQEAKARKDSSKSKADKVKGYAVKINEFRAWEKNQWQKLGDHENELAKNQLQEDEESTALKNYIAKFKVEVGAGEANIKAITLEINNAEEQLEKIISTQGRMRTVVESIPYGHPVEGVDETSTVEELISIGAQKTSEVSEKIGKIRDNVKRVGNILSDTDDNNKFSETWTEIKRHIVDTHQCNTSSDEYYLLCLEALSDFLGETLPNMRQLTIETTRTAGERYVRFYQSLDALNRKINSVSSKLEESISTANKFPALDDIRVTLKSKIHDMSNFNELKAFNYMWEQWGEMGKSQLPTQDYLNAFNAAIAALKAGGITSSLDSLVDININLIENGRPVVIRCDADLTGASSEGVSTLAVCVVFCGMTRFLCKDDSVTIHWPLDELGKLDESNTILLFEFMDANNITLFCAQPSLNPALMRYFPIKVNVVKGQGIQRFNDRDSGNVNPLLAKTQGDI
tara:strand:- start:1330 stop:5028 length:3699 start_codon:yes stop_codon:yes gene_type:complete